MVLGGVATKPLRASNVETALKGKKVSLELLEKASEKVFDKEMPLSMNSYRIRLTRELVRRLSSKFAVWSRALQYSARLRPFLS